MIRELALAMTILAFSLAGVIAAELRAGLRPPATRSPAALSMTPPLSVPAPADAPASATGVSGILARPLFAPSRRPAATTAGAATLPRLSGIIVSPAGSIVVLVPADGRAVVVGQGGRVGVYVLTSISRDSVTLAGPDGPHELRTAFAAAAGGAANAAVDRALVAAVPPETGPDWLRNVPLDLPSAASWDGPPALSALPRKTSGPVSAPLLNAPADPAAH